MRNIQIIIALLLGPLFLHGQNALQDALLLRDYLVGNYEVNGKTVAKIKDNCPHCAAVLWRYTGDTSRRIDKSTLFDAFAGNPFIGKREGEVKVLYAQVFNADRAGSALAAMPNAAASASSPGLFVNNLADGLAKFLVARTKEELSIAFFSKFQRDIDNNPVLKTLFPATAGTLQVVGNDIYQFNLYLQALRQSFILDLKALPTDVQRCIEQQQLIQRPEYQVAVHDVLGLSQLLLERKPLDSVFHYLASEAALQTRSDLLATVKDPKTQRQLKNLATSLKLSYVLSESLRSNVPGTTWLNAAAMKDALRDSVTFYLYMGLLWQEGRKLNFDLGDRQLSVSTLLSDAAVSRNYAAQLRGFVDKLAGKSDQAQADLVQAKQVKKNEEEGGYEKYYNFFNSFFSVLEHTVAFKNTFIPGFQPDSLETTFLSTLRHLNDMNFNIRQKAYSLAVTDLVAVLQNLAPEAGETRAKVLKYGSFIASVAQADNSDQVSYAIDAVALPPGSSILKKQSNFSVALNAFTGFSGGQEHLLTPGLAPSGFVAVAAPVGLAISKGFQRKGSLSLFLPIIDVGALVAYRFRDDRAESLPKLSFSNIVAPGAYLAYGFFNDLPITAGIGAQLGPNLREIDPTTTQLDTTANGWRWGGFISVDIPIVNFFSR